MSVEVKICGLSSEETLAAAISAGADLVGFNFYPPSPRAVTSERAGELAKLVPSNVQKVGLFVNESDDLVLEATREAGLDLLQLHGDEPPSRLVDLKQLTGLPVMKVIKLRAPEDLRLARDYFEVADRLLFDTKAPPELKDALPGGNALSFDWTMLEGHTCPLPWMLAGGLRPDNIAVAVAVTGTGALDVSSGVESSPGVKDTALIRTFLEIAKAL